MNYINEFHIMKSKVAYISINVINMNQVILIYYYISKKSKNKQ